MFRIYNTLGKTIKEFEPLNPPQVSMYSCGPTVYDYQHIGHMRRYVGDDILVRILKLNHYQVKHVMNITDVGHLVSDADTGEDKMEKGAAKFGLSVWDIAKKFERQFFSSCQALNIKKPDEVMHATGYIDDQIALIEELEKRGFTYKIADGIYFDSSKFPDYSKLSGQKLEDLKAGARIDMIPGKKHPTDFALWKLTPKGVSRQMEWESPWGKGFPGWHIECSAMSMRSLGPSFDIHTGGIDHIPIHHTNEIAQAEAATGKRFVKYWVHYNFLLVDGQKMSKSIGNIYTVEDIKREGFNPMALRYFFLQAHYRSEQNFTWEALRASQTALHDLYDKAIVLAHFSEKELTSREPSKKILKRWEEFTDEVSSDMNLAAGLAVLHQGLKEAESDFDTAFLLKNIDDVLGLDILASGKRIERDNQNIALDPLLQKLLADRNRLRKQKRFHMADQLRHKIEKMGYEVEDVKNDKVKVRKKHH